MQTKRDCQAYVPTQIHQPQYAYTITFNNKYTYISRTGKQPLKSIQRAVEAYAVVYAIHKLVIFTISLSLLAYVHIEDFAQSLTLSVRLVFPFPTYDAYTIRYTLPPLSPFLSLSNLHVSLLSFPVFHFYSTSILSNFCCFLSSALMRCFSSLHYSLIQNIVTIFLFKHILRQSFLLMPWVYEP